MRPPACVSCKWGTGTACEKPSNAQAQKEMKDKLELMKAERAKQDAAWFVAVPSAAQEEPQQTATPIRK